MVKALVLLASLVYNVPFFELAGSGLLIAAAALGWGLPAALAVGGGLVLLKSFDLELRSKTVEK